MIAYLVDVGILLDDDHEEYDAYAIVYDKCYAYYDENQFYTKTKEEAIKYVKKYIEKGVVGTYGVVSETTRPYDYDFENGEEFGPETYHPADVVYSLAKFDGEIKENFVLK